MKREIALMDLYNQLNQHGQISVHNEILAKKFKKFLNGVQSKFTCDCVNVNPLYNQWSFKLVA